MIEPARLRRRARSAVWHALIICPWAFGLAACIEDSGDESDPWDGTVDTLPSGTVEVRNTGRGIWDSTTPWRVIEEVRIGALEGSGPDLFGRISALEVDESGRFYVFESQAQELRVFDKAGEHLWTIGRKGGGPGEFREGIGLAWAPDGNLWVVDPGNSRISVFDTTGAHVTMKRILGGYVMMPWKGRFDRSGRFHHYGLDIDPDRESRFVMVRFDTLLNPLDTIPIPRAPDVRYFELRTGDGMIQAGVPFSAGISWTIAATGHLWFANTGEYRVFERNQRSDTVLIVSREFDPIPVTGAEVESAIADLDWFTEQGGRIDRSRIPTHKPAVSSLYVDDDGFVWIVPVAAAEDSGRLLDVFEPSGRYLGRVRLPFRLLTGPLPLFRHGMVYGVTSDEFDVPYVVRARVVRP